MIFDLLRVVFKKDSKRAECLIIALAEYLTNKDIVDTKDYLVELYRSRQHEEYLDT